MSPASNQLVILACIAELDALRYTPAGIPVLNLRLDHESEQQQAGVTRQVKAHLKAVATSGTAERLAMQALGSHWRFQGFLASPLNGKYVVFHISEFQQD